jgi:poly(3-hydroxybutyrate) depolymerase
VSYGDAQFAQDGKGVYVTTDKDYEFRRLAYIDLETKETTYLTTGLQHDVDEAALSEDGKVMAYVVNEDGLGVLHLMDLESRKELKVPKLPNGVVSDLGWRKNARELAFDLATDLAPTDVYSYDLATAKLERWTQSETGGLDTGGFARSKLVRWNSWDKREITGFLYQPPAKFTGRRPVIINIHGGPESQFRPTYLGRNNYLLNELGVAIVYPNVRGSSGFGKTFLALDNGKLRDGSYRDIEALLDWIKTQPGLDPERVLVTGGSYGGFMTLAVATQYNDRIRCSIDIVGAEQLRDLPREHLGLPAGPAPRRVRRRARSRHAQVPRVDRAGEQGRPHHQADVRDPGLQRPARAAHRVRADGRDRAQEPDPGLVSHGQGRGARVQEEEERRFPVLCVRVVHAAVPVELSGDAAAMEHDGLDPAVAAVLALALPVLFVALWVGVVTLLAHLGGWARLARHYRTFDSFGGEPIRFQFGYLGFVRYKGALTFGTGGQGPVHRHAAAVPSRAPAAGGAVGPPERRAHLARPHRASLSSRRPAWC